MGFDGGKPCRRHIFKPKVLLDLFVKNRNTAKLATMYNTPCIKRLQHLACHFDHIILPGCGTRHQQLPRALVLRKSLPLFQEFLELGSGLFA